MRIHDVQQGDGIIERIPALGILRQVGLTVPTDGTAGYVPGAEFIKTNGTIGATRYINEGSVTSCDFNAVPASTGVNSTALTGTVTMTKASHANRVSTFAGAAVVTLPATSGSGDVYRIMCTTTLSSATATFTCAGSDSLFGDSWVVSDGAAAVLGYAAGGGTVITMNGTTKGGIKGDMITLTDVATNIWHVQIMCQATGTEATPFS